MSSRGSARRQIKVVDLFAGPGGLGEGFSSYKTPTGHHPFKLALSIEKDPVAHQTLQLRAFFRQFDGLDRVPIEYWDLLRGKIDVSSLFTAYPNEAEAASEEAQSFTLDPLNHAGLRTLLKKRHLNHDDETIVIGGPPCQAYSVAGRSRNGAKANWTLETDGRSTLYKEYLQVLAELQPAAFVMENVRGLLSAKMQGESVIELILEDLEHPRVTAGLSRAGKHYRLVALAQKPADGELALALRPPRPTDFLIRAEEHGVPQSRQRVIIVGLRTDLFPDASKDSRLTRDSDTLDVSWAIRKLPKLRAGISSGADDSETVIETMRRATKQAWFVGLPSAVKDAMGQAIEKAAMKRWGRGGGFVKSTAADSRAGGFPNHETRGHMATDLHRYLFAAAWAQVEEVSPTLRNFPAGLLPDHGNVEHALRGGQFADRFRVQCWKGPSTTIVSHISKDGHYYIHPDPAQCRSLTVREAAKLQTFPDDYLFLGPRTAQFHQVGNAVPVELARRIAGALHRSMGCP